MSDLTSALLIVKLVSEGIGVASEIAALAKRVARGETITNEEIAEAQRQVNAAVTGFDNAKAVDDAAKQGFNDGEG